MNHSLLCTDKEIVEYYEKYVNMVYQICFMYLKNKADSEDMVQTTFIKFMNQKKPFNDEEHIKAWLIVTSSNLCKNHLKHWWQRNKNIDEIELPPAKESSSEILESLLSLKSKYKTVIYLYYYMGYSTIEIAKQLHQKESTIRSLLSRGRKQLKEKLGGEKI